MKKVLISTLLCLTLIFTSISCAFAESSVVEKPEINIVIDGKMGTYSNVPIVVNGRTLLPLRELLVNLGVQNDNEHITWNGSESSVTVQKDATQLYLKVGSKDANINNEPAVLDTEPVNYKSRVYIPARFVAQALGKKVAWNGTTKSVFINNQNQFDINKQWLDAAISAMQSAKTMRVSCQFLLETKHNRFSSLDTTFDITSTDEVDREKMLLSSTIESKVNTSDIRSNEVYAPGYKYTKGAKDNTWKKEQITGDELKKRLDKDILITSSDDLCAGMLTYNTTDDNLLVLQGEVYPTNENTIGTIDDSRFTKMYTQIGINRDTNCISQIIINCTIESKIDVKEMAYIYKFTNIGGDVNITIPQG